MHNIHYVRTYANNAQNACNFVESEIESWGDENNWRTICGAVNKKGKVLDLTIQEKNGWVKGRWRPNLKDVKECMNDVFHNEDSYYKESIDKLIEQLANAEDKLKTLKENFYEFVRHERLL